MDLSDFTDTIERSQIDQLALADGHEVVTTIQECFADFVAINPDLFCLFDPNRNAIDDQYIWQKLPDTWQMQALAEVSRGILAVLLALRKRPTIRFHGHSKIAQQLANEVERCLAMETRFGDLRAADCAPLLLILDRRNDPVTPLLTPWTYQAMIHEVFDINDGKIQSSNRSDAGSLPSELSLPSDNDIFYKTNMFSNFGDLGENIKTYVNHFQHKTASRPSIDSIEDIKRFIQDYPDLKKLSGNVSKHVNLISELSLRIESDRLLMTSEFEQNLVCHDDHTNNLKVLEEALISPQIPPYSKIRLVALYVIRYHHISVNTHKRLTKILNAHVGSHGERIIENMLYYYTSSIFYGARKKLRGLKGVDNVFTQHTPQLQSILMNLISGRLNTQEFPFIQKNVALDRPQDVIIYIVGGATYEEAKVVAQLNATYPDIRLVLGSCKMHNSKSFLAEVDTMVSRWKTEDSR